MRSRTFEIRRRDRTVEELVYGTSCAVAVAVVAACGGSVSHDAAPTGHAVASVAPSDSSSQCSSKSVDEVKAAAQRDHGAVDEVLCFGDWAKVLVDTRAVTTANPPSTFLFHDDGGGWRVVQYGSGFDCASEGVPPSIATKLEC